MSLQDDHFDLIAFFKKQVKDTKQDTSERRYIQSMRLAYLRVWESFVEQENENEKLRPVAIAVSTLVKYVVDTHYTNQG